MIGQYLRWTRKLYELNKDAIKQRLAFENPDEYTTLPEVIHEQAQCCFVLSTGRCGTGSLTSLLKLSKEIRCEHQPSPELIYPSKLAYESSREDNDKFEIGIDMARYELIESAFLRDQIYVETNNRITFFAPYLANVFGQSKFIHLIRHPGAFVRSGIRRKWYSGKGYHDTGRIMPSNGFSGNWNMMTQIEKIAWLWNETNQFIEDFRASLGSTNRFMLIKAEDLFSGSEIIVEMFKYLELEPPPEGKINKTMNQPVNMQMDGDFPKYEKWNSEQKEQLKKYALLYAKYGYEL